MNNLDIVCLENIFHFLEWKDLFNLSHVNKKFYKLTQKLLWRDRLSENYKADKIYNIDLYFEPYYHKEFSNSRKEFYTRSKLGKGLWIQYHNSTIAVTYDNQLYKIVENRVWEKTNGHINDYETETDYLEYPSLFLLGYNEDFSGKVYISEYIDFHNFQESSVYISKDINKANKYQKPFSCPLNMINSEYNNFQSSFFEMII